MYDGMHSAWMDTAWLLGDDGREVLVERMLPGSTGGRCQERKAAREVLVEVSEPRFPAQTTHGRDICTHAQIVVTEWRTVVLGDGRRFRLMSELQCRGVCEGLYARQRPGQAFEPVSMPVAEVSASDETVRILADLVAPFSTN